MPYPIEEKLVIAVASSALFDLSESDRVFREQGVEVYRQYQRHNVDDVLKPGVAFPLIRRLLDLNESASTDHPIEVILLSRNDPDTGLRVFRSIKHHNLDITRAAFVSGYSPIKYIECFNACLFLSGNAADVRNAIGAGAPAGRVFPTDFVDDPSDRELRIAFDFDGVIADDSAEAINQTSGLPHFLLSEQKKAAIPLPVGPLHRFLQEVAKLQKSDLTRRNADPNYEPRIRVAIVTARNAPAHERVITSLLDWGVQVDETFFLGGIEKARVLKEFKPHIFFDDQIKHIEGSARRGWHHQPTCLLV
jgi:5'-nucleotidase